MLFRCTLNLIIVARYIDGNPAHVNRSIEQDERVYNSEFGQRWL